MLGASWSSGGMGLMLKGWTLAQSWHLCAPVELLPCRQGHGWCHSAQHPSCHQNQVSCPVPVPREDSRGGSLAAPFCLPFLCSPRAAALPGSVCTAVLMEQLQLRRGEVVQPLSTVRGHGHGGDPQGCPPPS